MAEGPSKKPSLPKEMVGKSPLRDPANRELVEAELKEQQNPMKTMPNYLTSPGKGEFEAEPEAYSDVAKGEWDSFRP